LQKIIIIGTQQTTVAEEALIAQTTTATKSRTVDH